MNLVARDDTDDDERVLTEKVSLIHPANDASGEWITLNTAVEDATTPLPLPELAKGSNIRRLLDDSPSDGDDETLIIERLEEISAQPHDSTQPLTAPAAPSSRALPPPPRPPLKGASPIALPPLSLPGARALPIPSPPSPPSVAPKTILGLPPVAPPPRASVAALPPVSAPPKSLASAFPPAIPSFAALPIVAPPPRTVPPPAPSIAPSTSRSASVPPPSIPIPLARPRSDLPPPAPPAPPDESLGFEKMSALSWPSKRRVNGEVERGTNAGSMGIAAPLPRPAPVPDVDFGTTREEARGASWNLPPATPPPPPSLGASWQMESGQPSRLPSVLPPANPPPAALKPLPQPVPPPAPLPSEPPPRVAIASAVQERPQLPSDRPQPISLPPAPAISSMLSTRLVSFAGNRVSLFLAALSLLLSLVIGVLLWMPKNGRLRIQLVNAGDSIGRAEVFIDGEKKCEVVPCTVPDLGPGPKTIQVLVPGFDPMIATDQVEAGKERLVLVTLRSGTGAPAALGSTAASDANAGDLVVGAVTPASAHVIVDGTDRGSGPTRVKALSPGTHKLRFEADRYTPLERTVDIGRGQVVDIGAVQLKLAKGKIVIYASNDNKVVLTDVDSHNERQVHGPYPMAIEVDAAHRWLVTATQSGMRDFNSDISFEDAQPEKTVHVLLESGSSGSSISVASLPNRSSGGSAAPSRRAASSDDDDDSSPPSRSNAEGDGQLNINSIPPSKVLLDGKPIGGTPKTGVKVSAGSHTVTFIHPELGKKMLSVNVSAGQTATAAVRFKQSDD